MPMQIRGFLAAAGIAACMAGPASAADLTIGARFEPTIDPHFLYLSTNIAYARHVFEAMIDRDENVQKRPGLALSWKAVDDTTWEFTLRPGVKFHDGSDFTAADVAFSIERIPSLPNNPNPYTGNIRSVVGTEIVDPLTIRLKTDRPNPSLPGQLTNVFIVSHKAAANALPADFASGKATIGTGPFKFVKFTPADRYELVRNEAYWGDKPVWDKVTFRIIGNSAARVAALLAGDVDMIDFVPPVDLTELGKNPKVQIFNRPSDRVIYLCPNSGPDQLAMVTDKAGKPLDRNPFRDLRVRQAVSKAINREAMVTRIMEGLGVPASQLVPERFGGYNPDIKTEGFDPDGAKKLLAEAGYPDGFALAITCPSDRYVNDAKVCQAVGAMLARIGLTAKVETAPSNVYFSRVVAPKNEYPIALMGWGSAATGDAVPGLTGVLHSYDREKGTGAYNTANYRSPEFDQMVQQAVSTIDDARRETLMQGAMAYAMKDLAIVPLHTQMSTIAARKGLVVVPRADEQTVAMHAKPAQ